MMDVLCFIIALSALALRLSPRLIWKDFNGTDSYFHFFLINTIKNNKHKILEKEKRILGGSNCYTYPYYYHWVLSFFPNKFLVFWDKFSGSIFDIIIGGFLAWVLYHYSLIKVHDTYLVFSAYILSPGLTFSFIGPRPFSLTPRNFSQFIFTISICCLIIALSDVSGGYELRCGLFILASCLFALLLLSSQFGTQVLLFLLLAGFFNIYITLCIILSFFIGIIVSKGFLITQIKAHIHHLEWYFRYNYAFVQHKSNFSAIFSHIKSKNIRGIFYECLFFNQLISSFFKHTTYFLAVVLGIIYLCYDNIEYSQSLILVFCLSMLVPFILTNFGKMRVFGEAERYIEFVFPLHFFLFFSFLSESLTTATSQFLLIYNFIFYLYNLRQIKSQFSSLYDFNNLTQKLTNDDILLCLSNNETYIFLEKTKASFVGFLVNITLEGSLNAFFKDFFIRYPMVNPKEIKNLCERFNVTHILKNKRHGLVEEYSHELSQLGTYLPCYEDEFYVLYELKKNI